ncbi:GRRM system radical SAM/SPASM domain protein [Actinomadura meridiana]|uniref:GRRM system radical SAM/SPASM domain protein n=1 Tax=Actinomadura meridiana TaxID=559626 RepID=A0ABP8C7Z2_9ACTN
MTAAPGLGPVRRVILQPTGFCNIDCAYCYLPDRDVRTVMSLEVVEAVGRVLAACGMLDDRLEIRWHAGEPLTAPLSFYREACTALRVALGGSTELRFSLQTNGTLVTDRWCDLFEEFGFDVGVSVDGPAVLHDANRRTRTGKGTHARTMKGIDVLRARGIPFWIISVISELTLAQRDEYLSFVEEVRPASVGLNPEETEGEHRSGLFGQHDFRAAYTDFLDEMYRWQERTGIPVRRFAAARDAILSTGPGVRNDQVEPLCLLSVDTGGRMSSFSPELLGWKAPDYDDFVLGNVLDPGATLSESGWSPGFRQLADDIERGRSMCRDSCSYFRLCGGGAAVNKWTENGTFASTVTASCQANTMAVTDVVLAALEAEAGV